MLHFILLEEMWILVGQRLSQVCSLEMGSHEGKLDLNALASPVYVKGPVPWVSILVMGLPVFVVLFSCG